MRGKAFLFLLTNLCLYVSAQNKTYYISTTGNDFNDGLSKATAWQTFSPVNQLSLKNGDSILLEGGQTFTGYLQLDNNDHGTKNSPITISSYGDGSATIYSIDHTAIFGHNADGIRITKLNIKGNGSDYNGIYFLINQVNADLHYIFIDSINVFDFGNRGLLIGADNTDKGFNDITVLHSNFHNNNVAGMQIFGHQYSFSHTNLTIGYCKFYDNSGTFSTTTNSGTGLVISGVDGAVVQYCEAYNNGSNNRMATGGPYGIWTYDAKNVIIQFCESHHNKAGSLKDGGGFDIDGGSQYCTIQYCYSHDNEGPGFALVEYGSTNEFTNNIVRYNISQNDARKNSYGAVTLFAVDNLHEVKNSLIYNNTLYVDGNALINGSPAAFSIESGNITNTRVGNNIFYTTAGINLIRTANSFSTNEIYFSNNNYYNKSSVYNFYWGSSSYSSLNSWKIAATGQETNGSASLGFAQNPLLQGAGTGETIHPADGGSFSSLFGYSLVSLSPLIDVGMTFGDMGIQDIFGTPIPVNFNYDIGATEFVGTGVLPVTIINFQGSLNARQVILKWAIAHEQHLTGYEVQRALNGDMYTYIGYVPAEGKNVYQFNDRYEGNAFYRLKLLDQDGSWRYSNVIHILKTGGFENQVYYKQGQGIQVRSHVEKNTKSIVAVYSGMGQLVFKRSYNFSAGENAFNISDAVEWENGLYVVCISNDSRSVFKLIKY